MTAPNPEGDVVLAPCPLCGEPGQPWHNTPRSYGIICDACGCEVTSPDNTKEGAAWAWNRRAALQPSPAAPDGVREKVALLGESDIFEIADTLRTERGVKRLAARDYDLAERIVRYANGVLKNRPLAALPPVSGGGLEPVTWRYRPAEFPIEPWLYVDYEPGNEDGWYEIQPLYARQQAALGPQNPTNRARQ